MRALFDKKASGSSLLRFLDVRTKIAVIAATAAATVAVSGIVAQIVLFVVTLSYALLLKRAQLLAALYAIMALMMAIAALCAWGIGEWMPQLGGVRAGSLIVPFLRGLSMMNTVVALALTTRVEDLLSTLERMRLPFCVFLPTAVMLRFIPTFTSDIRQVWETLRIKGWPLGPVMFTCHPVLTARLILAPMLFRALKSAETLGVAAELKGMGSRERTVLQQARTMSSLDARVFSILILTLFCVAAAEVFLGHLWLGGAANMP